MFFDSEVLLTRSDQKVDVRIVGGDDSVLYTTIPRINHEYIRLLPQENLEIHFFSRNFVFDIDVRFKETISIRDRFFYSFEIENISCRQNLRSEKRMNVYKNGIYFNLEGAQFVKILDYSPQGMKIQTNEPIISKEIDLLVQDQKRKKQCEIVWAKEMGDFFQYGLKVPS